MLFWLMRNWSATLPKVDGCDVPAMGRSMRPTVEAMLPSRPMVNTIAGSGPNGKSGLPHPLKYPLPHPLATSPTLQSALPRQLNSILIRSREPNSSRCCLGAEHPGADLSGMPTTINNPPNQSIEMFHAGASSRRERRTNSSSEEFHSVGRSDLKKSNHPESHGGHFSTKIAHFEPSRPV